MMLDTLIGGALFLCLIYFLGSLVIFDAVCFKKSGQRETDIERRSRELGLKMNKKWQRR